MRKRRPSTRSISRSLPVLVAAAVVAVIAFVGVIPAAADTTPSVTLAPPSAITYTSAQLKGTVNPNGGPTTTNWHFEYSPTGEEGSFHWVGNGGELTEAAAEGTSPVPVEEALTGLEAGKTYVVRLVATNEFEQNRAVVTRSFSTEPISPPTVSIAAPAALTGSTAHFSGEINPEGTDPAFAVHWHFQCTPGCPGLEGDLPAGTASQAVEADATGLLPGTAYQVSLVAKNAGEAVSAGPETFTTNSVTPVISAAGVSATTSEAEVTAQINPGGEATTYYLEYGATPAYGLATGPKTLSAKAAPQSVAANIGGLAEGTAYHARLVATNGKGSAASADLAFTTQSREAAPGNCPNEAIRVQQGSTRLPDCRAYEMVSPVDKNGGPVSAAPLDIPWQKAISTVSADGSAAAFWSYQAFANSVSANLNGYRSIRGPQGWNTVAVNPPTPGPGFNLSTGKIFPVGATPDLSRFFLLSGLSLLPEDEDTFPVTPFPSNYDVYAVKPGANLSWISRPDGMDSPAEASYFVGTSADGEHVFFQTAQELVPQAATRVGGSILYEGTGSHTQMVGLNSAGDPISTCGSVLANDLGPFGDENLPTTTDQGAISRDGSRVYFTSPDPAASSTEDPACQVPGELYLRSAGRTTEVSRSRRAAPDPDPKPAVFQAAGDDGQIVYFSSDAALTEDAPLAGSGMLYAYHAATDQLDLVAPGGFEYVLTASDDGTRLYYVRGGSLFVYTSTTHQNHLIATATGLERRSGMARASSTTPDGGRFLFQSRGELTGYDSGGHLEIYLYDVRTQQLACLSCGAGGPGTADVRLPLVASEAIYEFNGQPRSRYLSNDGARAFFQTTMALLPGDINQAMDVYEWENGSLALVSDGRASEGSYFFGVSESGADVFISTAEKLLPRDIDEDVDIYDVRIDGGFPEPVVRGGCVQEACQGPIANPPAALASPASLAAAPKAAVKKHGKKKQGKRKHNKRRKKAKKKHPDHKQHKGKKDLRKQSAKSSLASGKVR